MKRMGQSKEGFRQNWESVKEQYMLEALRAKFTQHRELLKKLIATGDAMLVEHSPRDKYWGDGGDGGDGTK